MSHSILAGAVAACALSSTAVAARSAIVVSGAWSRPAPAGTSMGVVYLDVSNTGASPDRLIAATTPVAAQASLHRSSLRGGMMTMSAEPRGLPVPAQGRATLAPGGYHLMLSGLREPLAVGRRFPLTLRFAHAGLTTVQVEVRQTAPDDMAAMAAMAPPLQR